MAGKLQYGIGIKASIINFLMVQMIFSLERVSEHFKGLLGRTISQAVMLKYVSKISKSLEEWESRQVEALLKAPPAIHCDETSLRVDKKNYWVHSYSAGDITLKFLHKNRGKEAMDEIHILPRYKGIIIHDCWGSYFSYEHLLHGLCGSHLLRDLKFIEDSTGDRWATSMKKLLQKANKKVSDPVGERVLKKEGYKLLQSRYRKILKCAEKQLPAFPEPSGKKGRPKHTEAQNLWLRLKEIKNPCFCLLRIKMWTLLITVQKEI